MNLHSFEPGFIPAEDDPEVPIAASICSVCGYTTTFAWSETDDLGDCIPPE